MPKSGHSHIEAYSHHGRIGVLLELKTIDDRTAKTPEFKQLARDLAVQIAATDPPGIRPLDNDRVVNLWPGLTDSGQNGELLLNQAFIKNSSMTVQQRIFEAEKELRAEIKVVRFVRYSSDET